MSDLFDGHWCSVCKDLVWAQSPAEHKQCSTCQRSFCAQHIDNHDHAPEKPAKAKRTKRAPAGPSDTVAEMPGSDSATYRANLALEWMREELRRYGHQVGAEVGNLSNEIVDLRQLLGLIVAGFDAGTLPMETLNRARAVAIMPLSRRGYADVLAALDAAALPPAAESSPKVPETAAAEVV
jgi:hypothetical protein